MSAIPAFSRGGAVKGTDWIAAALSVAGTLIAATSTNQMLVVFAIWFVANVIWIAWALQNKARGVLAMNIVYLVISVIGMVNHSS